MKNKALEPALVSSVGEIDNRDMRQFFSCFVRLSEESLNANIQKVSSLIPHGSRTGTVVEVEGASIEVITSGEQTKMTAFPPKITVTLP